MIKYTQRDYHHFEDVGTLDHCEELTAEEFLESVGDVNNVFICYIPEFFIDEMYVSEDGIRIVVVALHKLSKLNKLWNKPIDELCINESMPKNLSISNFCKHAKEIVSGLNILGACPPEYRSKIVSMPFPKKWKQHQHIPGCEYQASYNTPDHIDISGVHKIHTYSVGLISLHGKFNNLRIDRAHAWSLTKLTAYLLDVDDLCLGCWGCDDDEQEPKARKLERFLSEVNAHRLDIGITWDGDFDQSLINITSCRLRAYNIWVNGCKVSIRSLNQVIKQNTTRRSFTTKSARNVR